MNDAFSTTSDHPPPDLDQGPSNAEESSAAAPNDAGSVQQKERAQRDHKAIMLDHLIRNVDIMIYAQLSVLYYMEYVSAQSTLWRDLLRLDQIAAPSRNSSSAPSPIGSTSRPNLPSSLPLLLRTALILALFSGPTCSACCCILYLPRQLPGRRRENIYMGVC